MPKTPTTDLWHRLALKRSQEWALLHLMACLRRKGFFAPLDAFEPERFYSTSRQVPPAQKW
jgi:hypothetical protein